MNRTKDLETQLRSWAPRRPSAKVEERLFGKRTEVAAAYPAAGFHWLVPATAAFLLLCMLFGQPNGPGFHQSNNSGPIMAVMLSNQSVAASMPSNASTNRRSSANTFEWTNGSGSTSSIISLSSTRGTN